MDGGYYGLQLVSVCLDLCHKLISLRSHLVKLILQLVNRLTGQKEQILQMAAIFYVFFLKSKMAAVSICFLKIQNGDHFF